MVLIGDAATRLEAYTPCRLRVHSPVSVDTTEKLGLEVHVVEVVDDGLPVGLDLAVGDLEVVACGLGGRLLFGPGRGWAGQVGGWCKRSVWMGGGV